MEHPRHLYSLGKVIALASSFLLMISAMLPWGVAVSDAGKRSVIEGLKGDGKMTIVLGALAVVVLILRKTPHWLAIIFGLMAAGIGVVDFMAVSEATQSIGGHVGYGLYMTIVVSVGIVMGSFIEIFKKK